MPLRWHDTWRRAHKIASSFTYKRRDHHLIVDMDPVEVAPTPQPKPTPKLAPVLTRAPGVDTTRVYRRTMRGAHLAFAVD